MLDANRQAHTMTLRLVFVCFICGVLPAYSLLGIPFPWFGLALAPIAATFLLAQNRLISFPGLSILVLYVLNALLVNVCSCCVSDFAGLMPSLSTTPYLVFVALRFLTILSALSFALLLWLLLRRGLGERLKGFLIGLGCFVSIVALYIYAAQKFGWYEIPLTRRGTSGVAVDNVRFSYAFHRLLGTFREPSHLAEWLILPMFLAFSEGKKRLPSQVLMSVTMLMTGSMTGICSSAIGFVAALVFFNPLNGKQTRTVFSMLILASLSLCIAQSSIYGRSGDERGILGVLEERATVIFQGGMEASNRGYVYDYVENNPPPLLGVGLGNSNLLLARYLNKAAVPSFLNIFFATVYSTGILGLTLIVLFFLWPIYQALRCRSVFIRNRSNFSILAAYISYCAVYWVAAEELSLWFAAAYVFLAHSVLATKTGFPNGQEASEALIGSERTGALTSRTWISY